MSDTKLHLPPMNVDVEEIRRQQQVMQEAFNSGKVAPHPRFSTPAAPDHVGYLRALAKQADAGDTVALEGLSREEKRKLLIGPDEGE